jgi:uncharacterized membrane protein YczE
MTRLRHYTVGDKSWPDILGEFVVAAITGVVIGVLMRLTHQPDSLNWSVAFALGLFIRGLRP